MQVADIVHALLEGKLLVARQWVADAVRSGTRWDECARPTGLDGRELTVAAGIIEMLASRSGSPAPSWTSEIGANEAPIFLDPELESMPRTLAHAKAHGPIALRERNLFAPPDFLEIR